MTKPDGIKFFDTTGTALMTPINFLHSSPVTGKKNDDQYYAPKSVAITHQGNPMVIIHPLTGGRQIWTLNKAEKRFVKEDSPFAASTIIVDKLGRQWAFATGLRVFMRANESARWDDMGELGTKLCNPRVTYFPAESRFVVHAKSCTNDTANIFTFRR